MKCTLCGGPTIVKDGRYIPEGYWRRRVCSACGTTSTTVEQFCATVKGNRKRQAAIVVPKAPKVQVCKARNAKAKPEPPKHTTGERVKVPLAGYVTEEDRQRTKARQRIEDMKMEKALEKL